VSADIMKEFVFVGKWFDEVVEKQSHKVKDLYSY